MKNMPSVFWYAGQSWSAPGLAPSGGLDTVMNVRCYTIVSLCVLMLALCSSAESPTAEPWQIFKGRHFLVHYTKDKAFAQRVSDTAEKDYRKIAKELGYTRHDGFWLWEKRAKIYVYDSRKEFMKAVDAPAWAVGKANYGTRSISTFRGSEDFLKNILRHELTHLIFRDFVGFKGVVPLWLDEGVAQWLEGKGKNSLASARILLIQGRLLSVKKLTSMDVKQVIASKDVPAFYAQAVSIVQYLLEEHGARRFTTLCGHLRHGKAMNDALRFTYSTRIRSIEELESGWRESLKQP